MNENNEKVLIFDISVLLYTNLFNNDIQLEVQSFGFDVLKFYTLKNIFSTLQQFPKATNVFLCFDSGSPWRRNIYSLYKLNRKEFRKNYAIEEGGVIDWKKFFNFVDSLYNDFKNNLPFYSLRIQHIEADDIIYFIVKNELYKNKEKIIITKDHDYIQLLKYENVKIYDIFSKKYIEPHNLNIHFNSLLKFCIGDKNDNIPPIKSRFGIKKAEKFIISGELDKMLQEENEYFKIFGKYKSDMMQNFIRNKKLIDFDEIPQNILQQIENEFHNIVKNNDICEKKDKLFLYFVTNKYRYFVEEFPLLITYLEEIK